MTGRRIAGLVLVIVGIVALMMGGVFWNDTDTVFEGGGIELQTTEREGMAVPPILGGAALVAGILLLVIPSRRRA
jgi:uncharacterized membrane protein YidH (DUF202 family)